MNDLMFEIVERKTLENRMSNSQGNTYRRKLVEVQAFQMTKERRLSNKDWPNWLNEAWNSGSVYPAVPNSRNGILSISTLAGSMLIAFDDYIVRRPDGTLYSHSPEVFGELYEQVVRDGI